MKICKKNSTVSNVDLPVYGRHVHGPLVSILLMIDVVVVRHSTAALFACASHLCLCSAPALCPLADSLSLLIPPTSVTRNFNSQSERWKSFYAKVVTLIGYKMRASVQKCLTL